MMILINLLSIVVSIIIVWDVYQLPEHIKIFIHNRLYGTKKPYEPYTIKPWGCSLCMTFWITLIYSVYLGFAVYAFPIAASMALTNITINRYIL